MIWVSSSFLINSLPSQEGCHIAEDLSHIISLIGKEQVTDVNGDMISKFPEGVLDQIYYLIGVLVFCCILNFRTHPTHQQLKINWILWKWANHVYITKNNLSTLQNLDAYDSDICSICVILVNPHDLVFQ